MCELFGISSSNRVDVSEYLKTLASHSTDHPHGWGLATFYGNAVSLEKEPKPACISDYLNTRLLHPVEADHLIAHIRLATEGSMTYENCHPFVKRDSQNRAWTLAHNGTIFYSPLLDEYKIVEEGKTDSERILCCVIDRMNQLCNKYGRDLSEEERFDMLDQLVLDIAERNKINLMIYDGDLFYIHTNMKNTLYKKKDQGACILATVPLDEESWERVPMMQLQAYRDGELVFEGTKHHHEYIKDNKVPQYDFWSEM